MSVKTSDTNEDVDLSTYRPLDSEEKAVITAMLCQSGAEVQQF